MALAVTRSFSSDWAIAITGYASPIPEEHVNELFAFYAIVFNHEIILSDTIKANKESPEEVQLEYVDHVIKKLLQCFREPVT